MKIVIISGSSREGSQSVKVASFMKALLKNKAAETELIDLFTIDLPPYSPDKDEPKTLAQVKNKLQEAEGFVMISPEWDGMMNHQIVSFYHYIGKEMADKPMLLVGVSSGRGGTYPIAQMQQLGQKNKRFVIIPEHLIVQDVKNVMNDHTLEGEKDDVYIKKRADYALNTLLEYAKALGTVRSSGVIDYETYPSGL